MLERSAHTHRHTHGCPVRSGPARPSPATGSLQLSPIPIQLTLASRQNQRLPYNNSTCWIRACRHPPPLPGHQFCVQLHTTERSATYCPFSITLRPLCRQSDGQNSLSGNKLLLMVGLVCHFLCVELVGHLLARTSYYIILFCISFRLITLHHFRCRTAG